MGDAWATSWVALNIAVPPRRKPASWAWQLSPLGSRLPRPCTALGPARSPQPACPLSGAGVVGVCLGGYLTETAGSWTPVFNLVAVVSSLGLGAFLVFGEAQRVDLSPARQDL